MRGKYENDLYYNKIFMDKIFQIIKNVKFKII